MTGPRLTLAQGVKHLERVVDQMESLWLQLLGIHLGLQESRAEMDRLQDLEAETDPVTELRATIGCVLNDDIRPALQDLRDVVAATKAKLEEE